MYFLQSSFITTTVYCAACVVHTLFRKPRFFMLHQLNKI